MSNFIDLDKLQRDDHERIIRIEAKLDNLSTDMKIANDGNTIRISDHDARIRKLEDSLILYEPYKNITRLDVLEKQFSL